NPHQLLVLMVVASIILIGIAFLFLTTQVRPIRRLADAAEAFGKGRNLTFRPAGAEEVRRAGLAFIAMRGRLERLIETRTSMLAGVSHDLRTPLTRMKLSLALIDDPEAKAMLRDVTVMEDMVEAFLAFARGDQLDEIEDVAPEAVLADAVEAARRSGIEVETVTDAAQGGEMALRRKGVARALQNLIDNAADHGGRVRATLRLLPRTCEFVVEDDGPGIPTESREAVLRPFVKLDRARNLDRRGGVGLGLAIAQDVARAHGGALELSDSTDLGGLRALLRLPR
ncbi:MAG: ATP-binding protein, partial [Pseudomonadota bacterium]